MGNLQADNLRKQIFSVSTNEEFERLALRVFKYQAKNNQVFKEYLSLIGKSEKEIDRIEEIIFLPVSFLNHTK